MSDEEPGVRSSVAELQMNVGTVFATVKHHSDGLSVYHGPTLDLSVDGPVGVDSARPDILLSQFHMVLTVEGDRDKRDCRN